MESTAASVTLANKKGLHARAAAKFVKIAAQFKASLHVAKIAGAGVVPGAPLAEAVGSSILGLMMLGAEYGATLRLSAEGSDAEAAVKALQQLVEEKFGEE